MQPPKTSTPNGPPQIGAPPVGPQTPVQGPQQPGRPAIGAGPQPAGAIESGPQPMGQLDESNRTKIPDGLYAHAQNKEGGPESETAVKKLNERGFHGPFLSQTAGPKAPAPGPMSQPVEGPKSSYATVKARQKSIAESKDKKSRGNQGAGGPTFSGAASSPGTTAGSSTKSTTKSTTKTMGKGKK